ncbi:MAG: zinc ribbon domain-containing protein [candidate division Zixibacteria bacterium]|nr:zinc ribbon domain-containing protein [candidate division Zixibacteria bacterium]
MPLFEYKCDQCGEKFEELVTSSDEKVVCPACQSDSTQKQLSTFAAKAAGTTSSCDSAPSCAGGG